VTGVVNALRCAAGSEFFSTYSLDPSLKACVLYRTCAAGTAVRTPGTAISDRTCVDCVADVNFTTSPNEASCTPAEPARQARGSRRAVP
jgi:hypothetical protein